MFYERYISLCEKKRISPSAAATQAGFNRGTVSAWKKKYENGADVRPEPDVISKICAFFDCQEPWLLGLSEQNKNAASQTGSGDEKEKAVTSNGDGLSEYHKQLVELAMQCPDDQAPAMLQAMQLFLQNWSK